MAEVYLKNQIQDLKTYENDFSIFSSSFTIDVTLVIFTFQI